MHNSLPRNGGFSRQNSPNRVHPALPSSTANTLPFPGVGGIAAPQAAESRLQLLVRLEGDMRKLPSWAATVFHAMNETPILLGQSLGYFFRANNRGAFRCEAASSVAQVDARAPLIAALEGVANRLETPGIVRQVNLKDALRQADHPAAFGLWLPLLDGRDKVFAGVLFSRREPWPDDLLLVADRLRLAYAHALRVHRPPALLRALSLPRWASLLGALVLVALACVPVPLTTLAPFEVVARDPMPVTAGLDGVIQSVAVQPNQTVREGQLVLQLDQTVLMAERNIASQRLLVAETRLATARSGAFADADSSRSVATLEQEMLLARAELDLAESRLGQTAVLAQEAGIAVFASAGELVGRPVRVGERMMDIASPNDIAVRVDVAVHDSVALPDSETLRLFFDHAPLSPRDAHIYEKSFHAVERMPGQLTYAVKATLDAGPDILPRIGMRGTAQLMGRDVPLGFYVMRRPLAALRQWAGL